MKENVKRVFYVRNLAHPCYLDIIAQRPEIRLDKLENETAEEVARPIITAAHAYQIGSTRDELRPQLHAQRDLLATMPNLLVVSTNGAGFDTVNVKDCTEAGVLVVNQTGGNAEAVASHVLAMMLTLSKQLAQTNHALRSGTMHDRTAFTGNDVHGRTIGIVGLGNVGRRVAELCRGLFRMQVIAYDPYLDEKTIAERGAAKVTLDELMRRADFVSINCPLDDTTRGMIGAKQFALMQPHAYFITTARGFIHDERALAEALRAKKIAGAGLDVWDKEPPPADHPLLQFDNVIASPPPSSSS
jgi:D-3-phosphoglycerate dehydrogenase